MRNFPPADLCKVLHYKVRDVWQRADKQWLAVGTLVAVFVGVVGKLTL